jgi:hypothetical protein
MQNISVLYHILGNRFSKLLPFRDRRNLATFIWMVLAAIVSRSVSLAAWSVYLPFDVKAASIQTRFRRWLKNAKIDTQKLYDILIRHALQNWDTRISLALDTSMLRDKFCMINISVLYRGRAFSIAWRIIKHNSSSVKFEEYQEVLEQARSRLPDGIEVVFLADRGFVSQKLMKYLNGWGWNWRIRIKGNQSLRCQGKKIRPQTLALRKGDVMLFIRNIGFGHGLRRLSLSAGWSRDSSEAWYILSNGIASIEDFMDYSQRFGIEEGFRDEKSGGFNLEESDLEDIVALDRIILIIAVATLVILHEGLEVIEAEKVREVDGHWEQGLSCFQIGWRWILKQLGRAVMALKCGIELKQANNPFPIAPTRKESMQRCKRKKIKWHFKKIIQCDTLP